MAFKTVDNEASMGLVVDLSIGCFT